MVCSLFHRAFPKVAEHGALSGLLMSEMLKWSVMEEDCTMYIVEEWLLRL